MEAAWGLILDGRPKASRRVEGVTSLVAHFFWE